MTYEYTPDLENRLKAIDLFLKYASPLLKAQLEKAQAEAAILRDKANKLSEDARQNELLDALVNLPVVESDIDADKV
jgi:phage terminase small subunit